MEFPLCPYIRRAWYNILQPNEDIRERVIFDYELLYIKEGKALITVEDRSYTGTAGDMFIFRPRQRHSIRVIYNERLVQPHIHFDLLYYADREQVPVSYDDIQNIPPHELSFFRQDILDQFIPSFPSHFRPHEQLYVEQLIFDIIHTLSNPTAFSDIRLARLFLQLWEQLLSELSYGKSDIHAREQISAKIKMYIEQNVSHTITLDEIADVLHFSRSYISRIFMQSYGIPPLHYHTLLRVQKARSMIRFTNMPLSEIAVQMGFDSPQNFSRVFRKHEGITPSAVRRTDHHAEIS
jgi:AraC-like DNA-binding protein